MFLLVKMYSQNSEKIKQRRKIVANNYPSHSALRMRRVSIGLRLSTFHHTPDNFNRFYNHSTFNLTMLSLFWNPKLYFGLANLKICTPVRFVCIFI